MAQQMIGTDYDPSRRGAPLPNVRVGGFDTTPPRAISTINSSAAQPVIDTAGEGFKNFADAAGEFAQKQAEAQQQTWLMQASSAYDLQAHQAVDEAQRNSAPGESIIPKVQQSLNDLKSQSLKDVDSPLLQQRLSQQIQQTQDHVLGNAQTYDFAERDRNTDFNFQQGLNNMATRIGASKSYDEANTMGQNYLGQALQTIQDTPALPEQKMKWTMQARGLIGQASNTAMMNVDGQRWVADHASAFPAQVGESVGVPRGIRNNNPGNIEGTQGFQGQTGVDSGGYATFSTPEDGLRALALNLKNQQQLHGLNTVQDIIGKWAPPNENNTPAYIQDVAQRLGVAPDAKLNLNDPATLKKMTSAIVAHENNGAAPYHDQSLDWAVNSALGKDAGDKPTAARDDGSTVNSNPLWNVLTYDEQQKMANEYVAKQRQERTILANYRGEATTLYQNLNQNMEKGIMPGDAELQQLDEAAQQSGSPSIVAQAQHLRSISTTANTVRQMNPTDLGSYIEHLQSMPKTLDSDNMIAYAQKFQKTQADQLQKNPLGYYQQVGHTVPAIDFNDVSTLQARAQTAHNLVSNYGTDMSKSFFTPAESNQFINSFNNADLASQRQMLWKFSQGFGVDTAAAASSFSKTLPNFGYAASLLGLNQTPDHPTVQTAMDIIAGDRRIKEDKNKAIPISNIKTQMQNDGWDKLLTPQMYDSVLNASQAVYAARYDSASGKSNLGKIISEVAGGEKAKIGNPVLSPNGVSADKFESFAQHITQDQIASGLASARQFMTGEEGPLKMQMPQNADGSFQAGKNKFILRSIGPNLYEMMAQNGQPYYSPDSPGKRAILRFNQSDVQ